MRSVLWGLSAALLLPATGLAADWHCRNPDLEILCDRGKCSASETFTPLDIRLDAHGTLSVCAYSGCWDGAAQIFRAGDHLFASGRGLTRSSAPEDRKDFMLGIDTEDALGHLQGAGFSLPVTCVSAP